MRCYLLGVGDNEIVVAVDDAFQTPYRLDVSGEMADGGRFGIGEDVAESLLQPCCDLRQTDRMRPFTASARDRVDDVTRVLAQSTSPLVRLDQVTGPHLGR